MEFKLLGPLEASDGPTRSSLAGRKQRALLARLLLDANRTVAIERLVDDLWGEDVPESAQKMVQIYVSQLRKVLPEGHAPHAAARVRDRDRPGGDRHRPLRATAARRRGSARGRERRHSRRRAVPRGAVPLARGATRRVPGAVRAGRGAPGSTSCTSPASRSRIDADLDRGRHAELVAELEALVAGIRCGRASARGSCSPSTARAASPRRSRATRRFRARSPTSLGLEPSSGAQGDRASDPPARLGPRPRRRRRRALKARAGGAVRGQRRRLDRVPGGRQTGRSTSSSCRGGCAASSRAGSAGRSRASTTGSSSIGRLIQFDKRGTGLSDRCLGIAALEERMDDVRAVMDAAGSRARDRGGRIRGRADGHALRRNLPGTHGRASCSWDRIARRKWAPDYPIGLRPEDAWWRDPSPRRGACRWRGASSTSGRRRSPATRTHTAGTPRYLMRGASPGAAAQLSRMNAEIDVRHVLPDDPRADARALPSATSISARRRATWASASPARASSPSPEPTTCRGRVTQYRRSPRDRAVRRAPPRGARARPGARDRARDRGGRHRGGMRCCSRRRRKLPGEGARAHDRHPHRDVRRSGTRDPVRVHADGSRTLGRAAGTGRPAYGRAGAWRRPARGIPVSVARSLKERAEYGRGAGLVDRSRPRGRLRPRLSGTRAGAASGRRRAGRVARPRPRRVTAPTVGMCRIAPATKSTAKTDAIAGYPPNARDAPPAAPPRIQPTWAAAARTDMDAACLPAASSSPTALPRYVRAPERKHRAPKPIADGTGPTRTMPNARTHTASSKPVAASSGRPRVEGDPLRDERARDVGGGSETQRDADSGKRRAVRLDKQRPTVGDLSRNREERVVHRDGGLDGDRPQAAARRGRRRHRPLLRHPTARRATGRHRRARKQLRSTSAASG